ncbi:MAG: tetratricopeptide repeat protein, partial [Deltaproteobacteria bacterium]|nr:tetratricopeptide repeat protein [Deltaproteobacteria bacterium]
RAASAIKRALAVDDDFAEVHAARGLMQTWLSWDWAAAERSFRASIERNPETIFARVWYSFLLDATDRHGEALAMAESALALDPLSPYVNTCVGLSLFTQGRHDEAIEALHQALEMEPDFFYTLWVLGGTYAGAGKGTEALAVLEKAATLSSRAPYYLGWLAFGCGRAGRRDQALAIIAELQERARTEYVAPTFFAWAYAGLGETEQALDWVEQACEDRTPSLSMHHTTLLASLRDHERFREVRRRMGLDP